MTDKSIINDLARAKAAFQARTVATVINGGPLPNEYTPHDLIRFSLSGTTERHTPVIPTLEEVERACGHDTTGTREMHEWPTKSQDTQE